MHQALESKDASRLHHVCLDMERMARYSVTPRLDWLLWHHRLTTETAVQSAELVQMMQDCGPTAVDDQVRLVAWFLPRKTLRQKQAPESYGFDTRALVYQHLQDPTASTPWKIALLRALALMTRQQHSLEAVDAAVCTLTRHRDHAGLVAAASKVLRANAPLARARGLVPKCVAQLTAALKRHLDSTYVQQMGAAALAAFTVSDSAAFCVEHGMAHVAVVRGYLYANRHHQAFPFPSLTPLVAAHVSDACVAWHGVKVFLSFVRLMPEAALPTMFALLRAHVANRRVVQTVLWAEHIVRTVFGACSYQLQPADIDAVAAAMCAHSHNTRVACLCLQLLACAPRAVLATRDVTTALVTGRRLCTASPELCRAYIAFATRATQAGCAGLETFPALFSEDLQRILLFDGPDAKSLIQAGLQASIDMGARVDLRS